MNTLSLVSPPRVLRPGINSLATNTERYPVRASGSLAITLNPGDELAIISPEGLQPGEICVFDQQGKSDMQFIGVAANGRAEGLKQILANTDKLDSALEKLGVDLAEAKSTRFFCRPVTCG